MRALLILQSGVRVVFFFLIPYHNHASFRIIEWMEPMRSRGFRVDVRCSERVNGYVSKYKVNILAITGHRFSSNSPISTNKSTGCSTAPRFRIIDVIIVLRHPRLHHARDREIISFWDNSARTDEKKNR